MSVRTTLTLGEGVLRMAKKRASDEDRPLKDVINDALRLGLTLGGDDGASYQFHLPTVKGRLMPAVDLTDRDQLFEALEDPGQ